MNNLILLKIIDWFFNPKFNNDDFDAIFKKYNRLWVFLCFLFNPIFLFISVLLLYERDKLLVLLVFAFTNFICQ
jgi:hypothetical protein